MAAILYDFPLAFNPAKAKLALVEKRFPFKASFVSLFNGQSVSPAFLKVNPKGTVPVLVDGSTMITESRKIVEYVDNKDGRPLGGSAVDRQKVAAWLDKIDAWDGNLYAAANLPENVAQTLGGLGQFRIKFAEARAKEHPELAQVYADKIASMKASGAESKDVAKVEANVAQLVTLLDDAEATLTSSKYLAGDEYSAADVMFTPILYRIAMVKKSKELIDPRAHVKSYWAGLKQRKSFDEVFGVANSPLQTAAIMLPALFKAWVAKTFNWY